MSISFANIILEFKESLKSIPIVPGKLFYILYDHNGIVFHHEYMTIANLLPKVINELIGKSLFTFIKEPIGKKGGNKEFQQAFFPEKGRHLPFLMYDSGADPLVFSRTINCQSNIINRGSHYLMAVHPQEYYMDRTKGKITEDMAVLIDDNNEILMACQSFTRAFLDREGNNPTKLDNYTMSECWESILGREEASIQYLKTVRDSSVEVWRRWKTYPPFKISEWLADFNSRWKIENSSLSTSHSDGNGVVLNLSELEQFKNDIRVYIKAKLSHDTTIGVLFHLDIYRVGSLTTAPDSNGYNFSIRNIREDSTAQLMLKRDTHPLQDLVLQSSLIGNFKNGEAIVDLCFEKCGSAFSLIIGKERIATLFDGNPIIESHHVYFGLLLSRGIDIMAVNVDTRPSVFDESKLMKQVFDMRFYKLPGRVFETRVGNVASNMEKPVRYAYMKDVTNSRNLMEQLNTTVNKLNNELETAKKIQAMLSQVNEPNDNRISIASYYSPSLHVGGDLVDIKAISSDKYTVVIYDVSGHGIGASLISAMAKLAFEHALLVSDDPSKVLELVNNDICRLTHATLFLTAFIGIIDLSNYSITYARAGHCLPEIFNNKRGTFPFVLTGGGSVLGHSNEFVYESFSENLVPGDRLFFYTDGLIEARNSDEQFYEKIRMNHILKSTVNMAPKLAADRLVKDVSMHMKGHPFQDDVTFLIVDIK